MKNTFYYLAIFLGLALTSCEPMEDIHNEINDRLDNELAVGNIVYTLTEDDYDELDLNFPNFNSVDDAKEMLPSFLSDKYPYYGSESTANITFDIYAPQRDEKHLIVYEATNDDYDTYGDDDHSNFDRMWQVFDLVEDKFSDVENRTLISLTYDYFTSTTGKVERNDGFLFINGEFIFVTGLTDADYAELGEDFSNFSSEDEAEAKLPTFLKNKFGFENPKAGDIKPVMYKLFTTDVDDIDGDGKVDDRATYSFVKYFVFDGMVWSVYNNIVSRSIQFGNIDGVWIPDNTIRYNLAGSDYAVVSSVFADIYPGPASNVGRFQSFDVRASSGNYWSPEMLIEAMGAVLDNLMPNAEEGQKYVVTFAVYNGSVVNESLSLIKTNGEWVLNQ